MAPLFVTWAESLITLTDRIWVETFFLSSPNFGPKTKLNFSEDLFFGLYLILGRQKRTDSEWRNFSFGLHYSQIFCPPSFENPAYASDYHLSIVN